jgi:hypothetical protein
MKKKIKTKKLTKKTIKKIHSSLIGLLNNQLLIKPNKKSEPNFKKKKNISIKKEGRPSKYK